MANDKPVVPQVYQPNYKRAKRSTRHEDRIAGIVGGRRLPRSGGLPWSKQEAFEAADELEGGGRIRTAQADIQSGKFMIEHKRTDNKSMSLKLDWLIKVREGAERVNLVPAMVLTFSDGLAKPEDWVLVPLSFLKSIIDNDK